MLETFSNEEKIQKWTKIECQRVVSCYLEWTSPCRLIYKSHEKSRHFFIIDLDDQSDQATAKKRFLSYFSKKVLKYSVIKFRKILKITSRNFENWLRDKYSKLKFLESP